MFPRRILGRLYLAVVIGITGVLLLPMFMQRYVNAAQITNRSLTLVGVGSVGGSDPGGVGVDHKFTFTLPTSGTTIKSVEFHYCTVASGTCGTVTGLSTTSATLDGSATSAAFSGWTVHNGTNADPYIDNTTGYTPANGTTSTTVQLDTITNPSTANYTFYVWITTYTATALGGTATDTGTVAAATANPIVLTGTMPESLVFCTGATVTTTNGIPDCTTATSGNITFPSLFSPTSTIDTTSQMAASTNASKGYVITEFGPTLTNGSNTVTAMSSATTSVVGTSQFGMNLEANTTPSVGTSVAPASDGVSWFGYPQTGYKTVNTFKFNPSGGDTVADSSNGGSGPVATDAQIYTVSYIVNVDGKQAPGSYTTTLTYICTATY